MRYFVFSYIFIFISCNTNSPDIVTHQLSDNNSEAKFENARHELEELKSTKFVTPDQFLISPLIVAKEEYVDPHWWSHWQQELNYREDKIPQGIIIYAGEPGEDGGWGKYMKWNNSILSKIEHYSFSKSGQLMEHVYIDSTRYYYDSNDRLCQTIVYSNSDNDAIESIRVYDYDEYGNILWNAVFFEEEDSIYMNHYSTYQYMICDSGLYIKEENYFTYSGEVGSPPSSVNYSYYDKNQLLRRSFTTYSKGSTGITYFNYNKFEDQYYLFRKETWNLHTSELSSFEITERDSLNRITHTKLNIGGVLGSIIVEDSTIYFPENEKHNYHFESSNSLTRTLTREKYDSFNNQIIYDNFGSLGLNDFNPEMRTEMRYELLEKGTWYASVITHAGSASNDENKWEEYVYRQFLDHTLNSANSTYIENPVLMELVEMYILKPGEFQK